LLSKQAKDYHMVARNKEVRKDKTMPHAIVQGPTRHINPWFAKTNSRFGPAAKFDFASFAPKFGFFSSPELGFCRHLVRATEQLNCQNKREGEREGVGYYMC
jgi:hypothetical protein